MVDDPHTKRGGFARVFGPAGRRLRAFLAAFGRPVAASAPSDPAARRDIGLPPGDLTGRAAARAGFYRALMKHGQPWP